MQADWFKRVEVDNLEAFRLGFARQLGREGMLGRTSKTTRTSLLPSTSVSTRSLGMAADVLNEQMTRRGIKKEKLPQKAMHCRRGAERQVFVDDSMTISEAMALFD